MSASSQQQNNGKKSTNSSTVNTPASTPITNISNNAQVNSQSSPPPNNAPKYGTLVPNRIFVGGISANTTEGELLQLFSSYGTVKAAKIIQDRAGVSRGYGFITFESEDDAKRPLREAENIVLRERKLNIAPAIKKQPFSRTFDTSSSPPAVAAGNPAPFFFPHGAAVPFFHSGMAYYPQATSAAPGDPNTQQPVYQPPTVYPAQAAGPQQTATYPPIMFPQPIYMPQQYPTVPLPYEYNYYQNSGGPPHYMVGGQGGPGGPQCPPIPQSNSPPRPHCYTQQMSYNPADTMFYNMPMYGTTMDGTPIYDSYDGSSSVYNEEPYNIVECPQQEVDTEISNSMDNTSSIDVNSHLVSHHQHIQSTQPLATSQTPILLQTIQTTDVDNNNTTNNNNNIKTISQKPNASSHVISNVDNNTTTNNTNTDSTRNTTTPVVSLLHIDQQQEKDYTSMQGGRKKKPPPSQIVHTHHPHQHTNYQPSGYVNNFMYSNGPYANGPPPSVCTFNGMHGNFGSHIVAVPFSPNHSRNGMMNGNYDRMKRRRNFNDKRFENNSSSRSSIRTDSNSSASVAADENKNDENKQHQQTQQPIRTNVNTPPPLPYSPIAVSQNYYRYNNTGRSFNNNSLNRRSNYNNNIDKRMHNNNSSPSQTYNSKSYTSQHNQHGHHTPHTAPSTQSPTSARVNNNNNNVNINSKKNDDVSNNAGRKDNNFNNSDFNKSGFVASQVHTNQNFGANNRRPRKQLRSRNTAGGNEIGAGDAPPMPNVDISEVCKKMENMKV